jgi:hypothetical protein
MLLPRARKRDVIGNNVPENIARAEERLEMLSNKTIAEAETWDWVVGT